MRRVLLVFLLVLGLGTFAALVVLSGPREIWEAAKLLPFWALFFLFGLELLGLSFWAVSWGILLWASGVRVSFRTSWATAMAGYAVSYLTPVAYLGGEPLRGWIVVRQSGATPTSVAGTLVWDRVIAGLVLLGFALFGAGLALPFLPSDQRFWAFFGLLALGLAVFLGALNFAFGWRWLSRMVAFFGRNWPRVVNFARKIREMEGLMGEVFRRRTGAVFWAFFFQFLSFLCH